MREAYQFEIDPFDIGFGSEETSEAMGYYEGDPLQGETGRNQRDYIRWVQRALNAMIYPRLTVDGILGSRTRYAIRKFQQTHGVAVDGIVGPQTEKALIRAGAAQPPTTAAPSYPPSAPQPVQTPTTTNALRRNIVRIAQEQWLLWGRGSIRETDPRILSTLKDYWQTGIGYLPGNWRTAAWSAAFISWVMRKAGAGTAFKYSGAHTEYVAAAKRNRVSNNSNPIKAYRVTEAAPRPGDIVCLERNGSDGRPSGVTYDNVDDGKFRPSHSDIVVRKESGRLFVIGGNLSDTVSLPQKGVTINQSGKIVLPKYYAVMRVGD